MHMLQAPVLHHALNPLRRAPEQVARVFERCFRADPSGNIPGTGLGMSLVKEIVELQVGRISIDSQIGQGASLTRWFP